MRSSRNGTHSDQVVPLSATMLADVSEVTKKFLRELVHILVKKEELTLEASSSSTSTWRKRIGRGGRFGRKEVAINFVTEENKRFLHDIETFYNTVEEIPMNGADLI